VSLRVAKNASNDSLEVYCKKCLLETKVTLANSLSLHHVLIPTLFLRLEGCIMGNSKCGLPYQYHSLIATG